MCGEMFAVDGLDEIQLAGLSRAEEMVRRIEVEDARLGGSHLGALVNGRKPPAGPVLAGELGQPARVGHGHVSWKIAGLGPEGIHQPASKRRPTAPKTTAIQRVK
jgi:hypothetical protein